jgi:membrane-bound lytic murein transglycosylase B
VPYRRLASFLLICLGLVAATQAMANDVDFQTWLKGVRKEALADGIRRSTLDRALTGLHPIPRVLELDRKQPERTLTFAEYMERVVSSGRIETARERLAANRALLDEIGSKYGVQPRFIVALWGIETDFGRITGGFPVIGALATLAYDGRRSAFFRQELINALRIVDQGHISPKAMLGSWAGAMGQSQFMPSSFLSYAVDYNGDGRRDIWTTRADVFASIANYLSRVGWQGDETWGREIRLPAGFDTQQTGLETRRSLDAWRKLGLRRADGGELPGRDIEASVVLPAGDSGPAFLVYANYRTLMKWNNSLFFATAVGTIADALEAR